MSEGIIDLEDCLYYEKKVETTEQKVLDKGQTVEKKESKMEVKVMKVDENANKDSGKSGFFDKIGKAADDGSAYENDPWRDLLMLSE